MKLPPILSENEDSAPSTQTQGTMSTFIITGAELSAIASARRTRISDGSLHTFTDAVADIQADFVTEQSRRGVNTSADFAALRRLLARLKPSLFSQSNRVECWQYSLQILLCSNAGSPAPDSESFLMPLHVLDAVDLMLFHVLDSEDLILLHVDEMNVISCCSMRWKP